jgi:polyphosphate:AMP phosphotransferase
MRHLSKAAYERRLPALRDALLDAQTQLHQEKPAALIVIVTGLPSAGRSEVVNQFLEWMNPKYVSVHALEKQRRATSTLPPMWRYWNTLPARGEIAIYFQGWYEDYLLPALFTPKKARKHAARVIERIRHLETMLPRDRVRVLKLHLHVDKKTQRHRIAQLQASKLTRWRVTDEDRWLARHHDRVDKVAGQCFRATSQKQAAWHVIDGTDPQHRSFEAGSLLLKELQVALKTAPAAPASNSSGRVSAARAQFPAHQEGESLDDAQYERELEKLRGRFALLTRKKAFAKRAAVLAFEGMDAAGKGGVIRRLTSALDARQYNDVSVSAPSPEELAHPYLWRFWRRIPDRGELTVFDRSWYGRVLVERVRGLTAAADWQRAYDEIREFELQLAEHGIIVHKFWLAVSKDEQLQRLKARDADPLKRFKVDPEDWANRRFYDAYQAAAQEMIERTDTAYAPWTVVEADDKRYARLKVLRAVCEAMERALD